MYSLKRILHVQKRFLEKFYIILFSENSYQCLKCEKLNNVVIAYLITGRIAYGQISSVKK